MIRRAEDSPVPQIFISSARRDDESAFSERLGFTGYLCQHLARELAMRGLDDLRIWRDVSPSHEPFEADIARAIDASDIFLIVLTERWLASEFCSREIELFTRRYGNTSLQRIIVVCPYPLGEKRLPPIFRDIEPFLFYASALAPASSFYGPNGVDVRFYECVRDLAYHLQRIFERTRSRPPLPVRAPPSLPRRRIPGLSLDEMDRLHPIDAPQTPEAPAERTGSVPSVYTDLSPAPQERVETLNVSAFAPRAARASTKVLVQVFLHRRDAAAEALSLAQDADLTTARRSVISLTIPVGHGQRIDVLIEADGVEIDEPAQYLIWDNATRSVQAWLALPPEAIGRTIAVDVHVSVGHRPAGTLRFTLPVVAADTPVDTAILPRGDEVRHYDYAFLSYSRKDEAQVWGFVQLLEAIGQKFFHDLTSMQIAEKWPERLESEINRCDLFLLFLTAHSAASKEVEKETTYAFACRERANRPFIWFLFLDPQPETLPDWLKPYHADSIIRRAMLAAAAKAHAPTSSVRELVPEGARTVYLMHEPEDAKFAGAIARTLVERGIKPVFSAFEDTAYRRWHVHREEIASCDAIVVCWANASEVWVRAEIRELQKLRVISRTQVPCALAIGAPPGQRKAQLREFLPSHEIDRVVDLTGVG
jgi:hypothetical protein